MKFPAIRGDDSLYSSYTFAAMFISYFLLEANGIKSGGLPGYLCDFENHRASECGMVCITAYYLPYAYVRVKPPVNIFGVL